MFLCHRHVLILFIGVVCLELFIQCNWTGPKPSLDPVLANNGQANQQLLATLSQDGQVYNYFINNTMTSSKTHTRSTPLVHS